jgi:predicted dehydrogenase
MIAAAEVNDVVLSIEHTRRWNAEHHAAREFIRSGEVGPLRTVVATLLTQTLQKLGLIGVLAVRPLCEGRR